MSKERSRSRFQSIFFNAIVGDAEYSSKVWLNREELAEAVQSKLNSDSTKFPYPGAVKDCIYWSPVVILEYYWVSVVQEEWIQLLSTTSNC